MRSSVSLILLVVMIPILLKGRAFLWRATNCMAYLKGVYSTNYACVKSLVFALHLALNHNQLHPVIGDLKVKLTSKKTC